MRLIAGLSEGKRERSGEVEVSAGCERVVVAVKVRGVSCVGGMIVSVGCTWCYLVLEMQMAAAPTGRRVNLSKFRGQFSQNLSSEIRLL